MSILARATPEQRRKLKAKGAKILSIDSFTEQTICSIGAQQHAAIQVAKAAPDPLASAVTLIDKARHNGSLTRLDQAQRRALARANGVLRKETYTGPRDPLLQPSDGPEPESSAFATEGRIDDSSKPLPQATNAGAEFIRELEMLRDYRASTDQEPETLEETFQRITADDISPDSLWRNRARGYDGDGDRVFADLAGPPSDPQPDQPAEITQAPAPQERDTPTVQSILGQITALIAQLGQVPEASSDPDVSKALAKLTSSASPADILLSRSHAAAKSTEFLRQRAAEEEATKAAEQATKAAKQALARAVSFVKGSGNMSILLTTLGESLQQRASVLKSGSVASDTNLRSAADDLLESLCNKAAKSAGEPLENGTNILFKQHSELAGELYSLSRADAAALQTVDHTDPAEYIKELAKMIERSGL